MRTILIVAAVVAMSIPAFADPPSFGLDGYYLHPHSGKYCNSNGTCIDKDDYERGVERRERRYDRVHESREDVRERHREEERREERVRQERQDEHYDGRREYYDGEYERSHCRAHVFVAGPPADSLELAEQLAVTAWMNQAKVYGAPFMDYANSRYQRGRGYRIDAGDPAIAHVDRDSSFTEKTAEHIGNIGQRLEQKAGVIHYQFEIDAVPCEPVLGRLNR